MQAEGVTRLMFVDETTTNLTYCRRYGRAFGGQRARPCLAQGAERPGYRRAHLKGLGALLSVNGALTGEVYAVYLDQVLGPTLRPGDMMVLDNLPVRKVAGLVEVTQK